MSVIGRRRAVRISIINPYSDVGNVVRHIPGAATRASSRVGLSASLPASRASLSVSLFSRKVASLAGRWLGAEAQARKAGRLPVAPPAAGSRRVATLAAVAVGLTPTWSPPSPPPSGPAPRSPPRSRAAARPTICSSRHRRPGARDRDRGTLHGRRRESASDRRVTRDAHLSTVDFSGGGQRI